MANKTSITYINVKGTVGGVSVDLNIDIPVQEILEKTPKIIDMIVKQLPAIKTAIESLPE